jgi:hypothetical protein
MLLIELDHREAFADDPYNNWMFDKSKVRRSCPGCVYAITASRFLKTTACNAA